MSGFIIDFSDIRPKSKDELWRELETMPTTDIFSRSLSIFGGKLTIRDDNHFITLETDQIFRFLTRLMKNAFWLSFRNPIHHELDFGIADTVQGYNSRGEHFFKAALVEDGVDIQILFGYGAKHESDTTLVFGEGITFSVPLLDFNRAVWDVYDKALVVMEKMLDGIDGFEDRFCQIPFRGENHIGNEGSRFIQEPKSK